MKRFFCLMAIAAMAFVSCKEDTAKLSIDAPAEITFNADGTGGVAAITVTTDQSEWSYAMAPTDGAGWLTAIKEGNQLKLTATPNLETTAPASVTITFKAGDAPEKTTTVSQLAADAPTLSTDAPAEITFNGDGTGGVEAVAVTTNQSEWSYVMTPEDGAGWLTAVKEGNQLKLTAAPNVLPVASENVTIAISAGKAPVVTLTVGQSAGGPEMVFVEGGSFSMGSMLSENQPSTELPVRQVTLSNFSIGKFEVTQALWIAVMKDADGDNNPSATLGNDLPVEKVRYDDIQNFIAKLNTMTGKSYRLPTEAEWEYAARGGKNKDPFIYAGSHTIDDVAWHHGNSDGKTHPVGGKAPNSLGIYDMTGNVSEYTSDWFKMGGYVLDDPDDPNDMTNPQGPPAPAAMATARKYIRGGNFGVDATITPGMSNQLTNTGRLGQFCYGATDSGQNYTGFRLVLPAAE